MRKISLFLILFFIFLPLTFASQEDSQKKGLFEIDLPDGWREQQGPSKFIILPPPPNNEGIVIQFKRDFNPSETPEEIKLRINSTLENIVTHNIKVDGGRITENNEITIDNVYAKCLSYTTLLNGNIYYFFRIMFVNKGYTFSIDYGNPSKKEVDKALGVVESIKF